MYRKITKKTRPRKVAELSGDTGEMGGRTWDENTKVNRNTNILAYRSLVRPVLEYGAACCDPCKEGETNALD
jgi:hypothetical protein